MTRVDGLHAKDAAERDSELVCLDDRPRERGDLGDARPLGELLQRVLAALADAHLVERERELLAERPFDLLGDLHDGGVEAEAGLDADGEQVECVREILAKPLLTRADLLVEDEVRSDEADSSERPSPARAPSPGPSTAPKTTMPKTRPARAAKPFAARKAIGVTRRAMPADISLQLNGLDRHLRVHAEDGASGVLHGREERARPQRPLERAVLLLASPAVRGRAAEREHALSRREAHVLGDEVHRSGETQQRDYEQQHHVTP